MSVIINRIKKFLVLFSVAGVISALSFSPVKAQSPGCADMNSCLIVIAQNTYFTLMSVNTLPNFLATATQLALSWLKPDKSTNTVALQGGFATLGNLIVQNYTTQLSGQLQLTADLYGQPLANLTNPPDHPAVLDYVPNINDLTYSSLLGQPPVPKAKGAASAPYNYIKFASGINISHTIPGQSWQGTKADQVKYQNYFATIMAAESFNGFALSNQYADQQNGNSFTTTQNTLITQASGSSWSSQVASEELGIVLRQLLLFESQTYVLLTQLVQTQKQMLAAQVMTNSLLILGGQVNESYLASKAQGVQPTR
jgi:hypothetical protein